MLLRHGMYPRVGLDDSSSQVQSQVSLGEMIAYLPIPGGHIKLAERFVDGAFSFTMGWNYWYNWTIILPAELSAASVLVDFWDKNTKLNSLWIILCLIVVVFINFLGAGEEPCAFSHRSM